MIARRWHCQFRNGNGKTHVLTVALDARELEAARADENPELMARAIALKRAYRLAPRGFLHITNGIEPAGAIN